MIEKAFAYTSLTGIENTSGLGGSSVIGQLYSGDVPLFKFIATIFYFGLIVAIALAVLMIIRGGYLYMLSGDSGSKKDEGKKRIQAAVGGLLLALGSLLILQTINPKILEFDFSFERIDLPNSGGSGFGGGGSSGGGASGGWGDDDGQITPPGELLPYSSVSREDVLDSAQMSGSTRKQDGSLNFTNYWDGDTNTNEKRGNANNLLRDGSVALSPDLIKQLGNPKVGSEIFVNGKSVGYFEDTTASSYDGTPIVNTIDIYDPNRKYGSVLKHIPKDNYNITVGKAREQIPNPPK